MAEFVEQSLEQLVPVFEQLERVQLFNGNEIRHIVKKCRAFEYRLQKLEKRSDDFLHYISYLDHLYDLIKKRRESINYYYKKIEIDRAVSKKIERLYRQLCNRFQSDLNFWMKRIEFNKKRNAIQNVSTIFGAMLQVHGQKEELWLLGSQWELSGRGSVENARNLLQKGVRIHSKSLQLWTQMFKFELIYVDRVTERRKHLTPQTDPIPELDDASDGILEYKLAKLVLREALESCRDKLGVYVNLWRVSCEFPGAAELSAQLLDCIVNDFGSDERAWIIRVEQILKKDIEFDSVAAKMKIENDAFDVLREGLETLGTLEMHRAGLELGKKRLELEAQARLKETRLNFLEEILSSMNDRCFLTIEDYVYWLQITPESNIPQLLKTAIQKFPSNVQLWIRKLEIMLLDSGNSDKEITKEFNRAISKVPEAESLPLWRLAVQWAFISKPKQVEHLLVHSLLFPPCVSGPMKQLYLEWKSSMSDCPQLQSTVTRLIQTKPNTLEMYRCCMKLLFSDSNPNIELIRKCFNQSIDEFGSSDPQLWVDFLIFESGADVANVSQLYKRALMQLSDADAKEQFVTMWTLRYSMDETMQC